MKHMKCALLVAIAVGTLSLTTQASAGLSLNDSKLTLPAPGEVVELKDTPSKKTKKAKKKAEIKKQVNDTIIRLSESKDKDSTPVRTAKVSEDEVKAKTPGAEVKVNDSGVETKIK